MENMMPYDPAKNNYAGYRYGPGSPAYDWYTLSNADIGSKELPSYGRALEVSISFDVSLPLTLQVVPLGGQDTDIRTLVFYEPGQRVINRGIRRIVTVAGGVTIPAGVQIDIIRS